MSPTSNFWHFIINFRIECSAVYFHSYTHFPTSYAFDQITHSLCVVSKSVYWSLLYVLVIIQKKRYSIQQTNENNEFFFDSYLILKRMLNPVGNRFFFADLMIMCQIHSLQQYKYSRFPLLSFVSRICRFFASIHEIGILKQIFLHLLLRST